VFGADRQAPHPRRGDPGCWGMLVACKTGAYVSERNPADHTTIEAGSTHVCRDYWLARERPELFKPADKRDARTYREHRAHLERTRQELERGRPTPTATRTGLLPTRKSAEMWRLPSAPSRRPLRLPR
jgi:hypothetical protein